MNCRRVINLMSAYVDGELTGNEMLEIRRHLSGCSECEREHESILFTKQALFRLRTAVPRQDFAASIVMRLDEVQIPPYQRFANSVMRFMHGRLSPVAAALAASGVALVIMTAGGVDNSQMTNASTVALTPAQMTTQDSGFVSELHRGSISYGSQPLVVANEGVGYGKPELRLASLSSR